MAWIESHQELADHPKTRRFAKSLQVGIPEAIGYLHLLWWWALSYSVEGRIEATRRQDASRACHRLGKSERFWQALVTAGFVDEEPDGALLVHDWHEYAGRLVEQRRKDAERKRDVRRNPAGRPADVRRTGPTGPNQPDPARAREPGPGGPLAAALTDPERLPNGAKQCPLCPEVFTTSYADHLETSTRHKIRDHPEDFKGKGGTLPPVETPSVPESLEAEHERLLAKDRANGK